MLADTAELSRAAAKEGVGLGAFNVILLEQAEAFVAAAEATGMPVVLQYSQNAVKYHRGQLAPLALALLALARLSPAKVAVHLDHAEDVDLCREAIRLGFSSIMYDGSRLSDEDNRITTALIATEAHQSGVSIEAELGEVGGKNGVHAPGVRTNPSDALKFATDTGVDLLAVAVGSSHAMQTRDAILDTNLISALQKSVPVPLVLHGSSGVSDSGMQAAIKAGMTKINVSTHLNTVFTTALRSELEQQPRLTDPRKYVGPAAQVMQTEAERLLRLYQMR